jgi:hypothetical protein
MGLKEGWIIIGDPVFVAFKMHQSSSLGNGKALTICNNFTNKYSNLHQCCDEHHPGDLSSEPALPFPSLLTRFRRILRFW